MADELMRFYSSTALRWDNSGHEKRAVHYTTDKPCAFGIGP